MLGSSLRSRFTRPIKTSYGIAHGRMQLVVETGASAQAVALACTLGAVIPSADMMRPLVGWLTTTLTALGGAPPGVQYGATLSSHCPSTSESTLTAAPMAVFIAAYARVAESTLGWVLSTVPSCTAPASADASAAV